jgi:hypothetical protein
LATTISEVQTSASELSSALRAMFGIMHAWLEGTLQDITAAELTPAPGSIGHAGAAAA